MLSQSQAVYMIYAGRLAIDMGLKAAFPEDVTEDPAHQYYDQM